MNGYLCPSCLAQANTEESNTADGYTLHRCRSCEYTVPVINGIKYFTEAKKLSDDQQSDPFADLYAKLLRGRGKYEEFLKLKRLRGAVDSYSSFRPFNESSRAFYPFIDLVRENLKPGAVILNTWCRTGWSSFFLSGLFPEQRIISIWEGNRDVLGSEGFDYWFGEQRKPKNVEIIFHDLNKPIPLSNQLVDFVFGLDTLHRYEQSVLIPEILRVAKKEGIIIFPHVHLTNSDPEPFFERGENQQHGCYYEDLFASQLKGRHAEAFVLSEPGLFSLDQATALVSDPETTDYNALVAIIPEHLVVEGLKPFDYKVYDNSNLRILVNPLLMIDLSQQRIKLDRTHLSGSVEHLLNRHQVYLKKVKNADNFCLSELQTKVIYWAQGGYSVYDILRNLGIELAEMQTALDELIEAEIVHVLPLSEQAIHLQQFHSGQAMDVAIQDQTLGHLWRISGKNYQTNDLIIDCQSGDKLSYGDAFLIVDLVQKRVANLHLNGDDIVCICSKPHFESLLVYWALTSLGITACMLNSELSATQFEFVLNEQNPALLFLDGTSLESLPKSYRSSTVLFDSPTKHKYQNPLFSDWLYSGSNNSDNIRSPSVKPSDNATILYTSGSTGKPKGVVLSHRSLFKSAKVLAENYQWNQSDKLLVTTEFDSMSGLRNSCLATLVAGVTIVIPQLKKGKNTLSIINEIENQRITLLTATPALIKQMVQLGEKVKVQLNSLRQVICTGGFLPPQLVDSFELMFDIRVLNYYGLTETTGLCIGEPVSVPKGKGGSIGVAVDAICQVVDDEKNPLEVGHSGELRVYTDRLMLRYFGEQNRGNLIAEDGWLYTGDLAYQDSDGYFFLEGRRRNIWKNEAGQLVHFSEIERALHEHALVKDVFVNEYMEENIEYLAAFVVPNQGSQFELSDTVLKQYLARKVGAGKVPRKVIIVDEFELDQRDQIDKNELLKKVVSK